MNLEIAKKLTITLAGFMGCGKSSIGRVLSNLLGCEFIDLDHWIETGYGRNIREIFAENGEAEFRRLETEALSEIFSHRTSESGTLVLSLGGGTLTADGAAQLILDNSVCIYLRAGISTLCDNLTAFPGERPMMNGAKGAEEITVRIKELMDKRSSLYEEAADYILDIDGKDYADVAEEIKTLIRL